MNNAIKTPSAPWSNGIGTNVKNCHTAAEVMAAAGLNFNVQKCELVARMPFTVGGNLALNEENDDFAYNGQLYRTCHKAYATYRTDINMPLGVVKDDYNVVQNVDAFTFFDDAIGEGKAQFVRAGQFGFGEKIFVTVKLPDTFEIGGDPVDNYLVFSNSHNGMSSVAILFTPLRVMCTNMLVAATDTASSSIRLRHTASVHGRLATGAEILKAATMRAETTRDLYNSLNVLKKSDEEVMRYIAQVYLSDEEFAAVESFDQHAFRKLMQRDGSLIESADISTRKLNVITDTYEYYHIGVAQQDIIGTAWGAYNAITGYYSNVAKYDGEKRANSLLYGNANRVISNALKLAM